MKILSLFAFLLFAVPVQAIPIRVHVYNSSEFTEDELRSVMWMVDAHYQKIGLNPRFYYRTKQLTLPENYEVWDNRAVTFENLQKQVKLCTKGRTNLFLLPNLRDSRGRTMTAGTALIRCTRRDCSATVAWVGPKRFDGSEGFTFAELCVSHELGHATCGLLHMDLPVHLVNLMNGDVMHYASQSPEFNETSKQLAYGCQKPAEAKRVRRGHRKALADLPPQY